MKPLVTLGYVLGSVVLLGAGPLVLALSDRDTGTAERMAARAAEVLGSLSDEQRAKACFEFEDAERKNWHFVPKVYPGVPLQDLSQNQKRAVHRLLETVLSSTGYHKTTTIMQLEDFLRRFAEAAGRQAPHRDPGLYSLAFFGKPGQKNTPWGFRLQGHHISWNFSSVDHRIVATTPAFLGANPAEVRQGPHAGLRALPDEEDLAFDLLVALTPEQKKRAILTQKAPSDILWGPGRKEDVLGKPRGLPFGAMTAPQRRILWRLIETFAHNLEHELAAAHLTKIEKAGRDSIHFAWMGSTQRGRGHYYRVHGATFVLEYDNTQNDANHVHTVWHDRTDDFGEDLLKKHYEEHHKK